MSKKNNSIYSEKHSTSLVGIIWLLIFSTCMFWNEMQLWWNFKSNVKESYKESITKKAYLTIWAQTVIIWWQEYEVIINPKY